MSDNNNNSDNNSSIDSGSSNDSNNSNNSNNSYIKFSALPEEIQYFGKFVKEVYGLYPEISKSDFLNHLDGDAQVLFLKKNVDESKTLAQIIEEIESTLKLIQKSEVDTLLDFPKQKFTTLESLISKFILINEVKDLDETFRIHIFLDSLPPILRYEVSKCGPISVQDVITKTRLVENSCIKCFNFSLFDENPTPQYGFNNYQTPFFSHPSTPHYIASISSNSRNAKSKIDLKSTSIISKNPNGTDLNTNNKDGNSNLPSSGPSIPSRAIDWKPRGNYYGPYRGQVVCFYCGIIGHKELDCRKKLYSETRKKYINNNSNSNNNSSNPNQNNSNTNNENQNNSNNNPPTENSNRRINIKSTKTTSTKNNTSKPTPSQ